MEIKLILVSFLFVSLIPDLSFAQGKSGKSGNSGNSINQCSDQPCGDHGTCNLKTGDDNGHCFCPGNNPACSGDCNTEATCTFPSGKGGNQCKLNGPKTPGGCVCRRDYVCTCKTGWTGQHCEQPAAPPECTDYQTLTEKDRSVEYDDERVDGYIYVDLNPNRSYMKQSPSWSGEGWYRVEGEAGTRLAEQDQWKGNFHCGTLYAGYMINTKHEDLGLYQTKEVEFCFGKSGCENMTQGKITRCNAYFVYYLTKPTDSGYGPPPARYCSVP